LDDNLGYILKLMHRAATLGADIAQFPEVGLPGYARLDFPSFSGFDWPALAEHTNKIMACAENLKIWVVLGSCRQPPGANKPRNCLHVISPSAWSPVEAHRFLMK